MPLSITHHLRTIERFGQLASYIDRHLDDPLDLQQLADVAGLSQHHLDRAYQAYARETPMQRVRRLRLLRARQQLAYPSQHGMLDIALDAGYASVPAFTHAFRRQFGVPPSHCRSAPPGACPVRIELLPALPVQMLPFEGTREGFRKVSYELRARAMACDIDRQRRFGWQVNVETRLTDTAPSTTIETGTGLLHEPLGQSIPGLARHVLPQGHYAVFAFCGSTHIPSRAILSSRILHETGYQLGDGPWLRRCRNTEYLPASWENRFDLYLPIRLSQQKKTGIEISRFILEK